MNQDESISTDRRGFNAMVAAAMAGLLGGNASTAVAADEKKKSKDSSNPLLVEPHICKGLNTCRGLGKDKKKACAGQGSCFTIEEHDCHGFNKCRGQGACDIGNWPKHQPHYPGENTCEKKGGCQVPLLPEKKEMWIKARRRFEALMADNGKTVGKPPADTPPLP